MAKKREAKEGREEGKSKRKKEEKGREQTTTGRRKKERTVLALTT